MVVMPWTPSFHGVFSLMHLHASCYCLFSIQNKISVAQFLLHCGGVAARYGDRFFGAEDLELVSVVASGHGDNKVEVDDEGTMTLDKGREVANGFHNLFQCDAQGLVTWLVVVEIADVCIVRHRLNIDDVL